MTFGYTRNEYIASIMSKPHMEISHQSLKHTLGRVTLRREKTTTQSLKHTQRKMGLKRETTEKKILSMKKDIDKGN